jgi:hypothetical protein
MAFQSLSRVPLNERSVQSKAHQLFHRYCRMKKYQKPVPRSVSFYYKTGQALTAKCWLGSESGLVDTASLVFRKVSIYQTTSCLVEGEIND